MHRHRSIVIRIWILLVILGFGACSEAPYKGGQGNEPILEGLQAVMLPTSDGHTVFAYLHRPVEIADSVATVSSGGIPLILAFHQGGASGEAEYAPIIPRLLKEGFAVLTIDQRRGGNRFMGHNETAASFDQSDVGYCDAIEDLEAAYTYAASLDGIGEIIAWGSSYSATLAVKLAVNHPEGISRVLAFSPASGETMSDCSVLPLAFQLRQPALFLRPHSEMSIGSAAADLASFASMGHDTFIATPGSHGSSMLVTERAEGDTEQTWEVVLEFLSRR